MASLYVEPSEEDSHRFKVVGELDFGAVDVFADAISAVPANTTIVLDLDSLSFVDSSGLKALLHARSGGRQVVLANPRSQTLRILEIAEVIDLFPIETTTH